MRIHMHMYTAELCAAATKRYDNIAEDIVAIEGLLSNKANALT